MQIQLKQIKEEISGVLPFDYQLDLSDVEPCAPTPIRVFGHVVNRAGVLLLDMEMSGSLQLCCDRCVKEFVREKKVSYEVALVDHVDNEETDDLIVCADDVLELDDLASQIFILSLDSKTLCKEDCQGLCPTCGADLNESTCGCEREQVDPRLEALRALLDEGI